MLYILHGTDTAKVRGKAHALIETLQKKRPDAEVFYIDSESFSQDKLKELAESVGLFSSKYIVVLSRVFENKNAKQSVLDVVQTLATAEHVFLLIEEALSEKEIKILEKHAAQITAYDVTKIEKPVFNTFALGDALGARDKKRLWTLYIQAKDAGISDEEIHGVLWWAIKNIALAQNAKTAGEAGLKPFVFSKAKKFAGNFKEGGAVQKTLTELTVLFHESRRGKYDLATGLERWILT